LFQRRSRFAILTPVEHGEFKIGGIFRSVDVTINVMP
jgi:hypothetical protein